MGLRDHDPSVAHDGHRDDINLEVIKSSGERVEVQCSVCRKRFHIPQNSMRSERKNAKMVHYDRHPDIIADRASSAMTLAQSVPSKASLDPLADVSKYVVAPNPEGRRYLKYYGVDDVILSVHREDSGGVSMLKAEMVDKRQLLLGRDVQLQQSSPGYPQVMYQTGSVVDLDEALRKCRKQFLLSESYRQKQTQTNLNENREWRDRVAAFALLASRKARVEDFTADNIDKCIDLLCDELPHDSVNGIYDEKGNFIGNPPRHGTHVPSHYLWTLDKQCILDYHPPGSMDSPVHLLPVLIDIIARDRRSFRHLVVLQLRSGESIKTWMSIYDEGADSISQMEKLFPQMRALLGHPTFKVAFWTGEKFPPPERVVPKVETAPMLTSNEQLCRMLTYNDGQHAERPVSSLLGLTLEEASMPPPKDDDGGVERRLELKREILESKVGECLTLIDTVKPDDEMRAPGINEIRQMKLDGSTERGPTLESHTRRLVQHVAKLPLKVRPRKLPAFVESTIEELESYKACDEMHRAIAALHARQGDEGRVNLDNKSIQQLEHYWAKVTL